MTVYRIPTATDLPSYEQRTALDGRDYFFVFNWNEREGAWYLAIRNQDEESLIEGLKIVVGSPLLRLCTDRRLPFGELVAIDLSDSGRDPGLSDLGERVILYYTDDVRRIP